MNNANQIARQKTAVDVECCYLAAQAESGTLWLLPTSGMGTGRHSYGQGDASNGRVL